MAAPASAYVLAGCAVCCYVWQCGACLLRTPVAFQPANVIIKYCTSILNRQNNIRDLKSVVHIGRWLFFPLDLKFFVRKPTKSISLRNCLLYYHTPYFLISLLLCHPQTHTVHWHGIKPATLKLVDAVKTVLFCTRRGNSSAVKFFTLSRRSRLDRNVATKPSAVLLYILP